MISAMGAASLALYTAVGSDRYLRPGETSMRDVPAWYGSVLWQTYTWQFSGFTGARLDPLFHRLDLATMPVGRVRFAPDCALAIVDTGPSLQANLSSIAAVRDRVCLATSLRGADALRRAGLFADLVIIEHPTAQDAEIASREAAGDGVAVDQLGDAWIALGRRTPPPLAARVAGPRTFVLADAPSWGLWPATVAAMGAADGVKTIGLVGVDRSKVDAPAPEDGRLTELLSTLAHLPGADIEMLDCGPLGASRPGWTRETVRGLADRSLPDPMQVALSPGAGREAALVEEGRRLLALAPIVKDARAWLEAATRIPNATSDSSVLNDAAKGLMAWANDRETRHALIDTLALSFLPRVWRQELLDDRPWRPLVLALHELVTQADALYARLAAPTAKGRPLGRVNGKSPFVPALDVTPAVGV